MRVKLPAAVRAMPARAVDALGSLAGTLAQLRLERSVGRPATPSPMVLPDHAPPVSDLTAAGRANLSLVVDTCERAGIDYFAVIEPMARAGRIAVADPDWDRLCDAIAEAARREAISVDYWDGATEDRRTRSSADQGLRQAMCAGKRLLIFRSYRVEGSPAVLGRPYGCTVERWSVGEDGTLTSPTVNEIAQVIGTEGRRPVQAEVLGRTVTTLPAFTTRNAFATDFPIDVVIPWIDIPGAPGNPALLRYTLRSIRDNLPWVHTVFLVTDGQTPPWLAQDDEAIRQVDVNELLEPRGEVPTSNPGAVRAVLHHLDGLAEHYLLIESGTLIKRHLRPAEFFFANGVTRLSFAPHTLPHQNRASSSPEVATRHNVVDLLHREFGRRPARAFAPGHSVQRRSILLELEDRYPDAFKRTWCSPFPAPTDVEVSGWLHNYYAYFTGRAAPAGLRCEYVDPVRDDLRRRLRDLGRERVDTVSFGHDPGAAQQAMVQATLERWFPIPAGHELYSTDPPAPDRSWG